MPSVRLTRRTIDALQLAKEGQVFYRDDEADPQSLRLTARGHATFRPPLQSWAGWWTRVSLARQ
jgi:hypothetical protein